MLINFQAQTLKRRCHTDIISFEPRNFPPVCVGNSKDVAFTVPIFQIWKINFLILAKLAFIHLLGYRKVSLEIPGNLLGKLLFGEAWFVIASLLS